MKIFYLIFRKIGGLFFRISDILAGPSNNSPIIDTPKVLFHDADQKWDFVIQNWFNDKGDETLRLDYILDENSVVFDIGGYKGDWAANIFIKYACNIYIFEPVPMFAESIKKRFFPNPKIKIFSMGLGNETKDYLMSVQKDGSSLYRPGDIQLLTPIKKASDFFYEQELTNIDLMKINIEGGEYDLLDHIISNGIITSINNIQIQFHRDFPNAEERMSIIQQKMAQTHYLTFQYTFVWENWKIK